MKTSAFLGCTLSSVLAIAMLTFGCSSGGTAGSGGTPGDGGSGGTAGDRGTGGSNGTGVIGPEGGVVTGEQGVTVTIPAGALASETTIRASVVEASGLPARPSGTTAAGPFVALTPHGTQFAMPVEVALPYTSTSASLTVLRIDDENDTTWEALTGAFDSGTATIGLSHFSILTVAAMGAGGTGGTGGSGGSGGSGGNASCEGFDNCIGPDGGYIWVGPSGLPAVVIPEGALAAATPIEVGVIDGAGLPALPAGLQAGGPFVTLTPHGTQFAVAVELTLPYDCNASELTILRLDDENDPTWEVAFTPPPFCCSGGSVTIEIDQFSLFTVAVNTCLDFDSCTACTSNEDCESHEFCAKDGCDGPGVCRQGTCRGGNAGVCGCDGLTYESPRQAGYSRANVASDGRCECNDNTDCVGQFETCEPFYVWGLFYGVPSCDVSLGCMSLDFGICFPDPNDCCPDEPVCGCDGTTYACPDVLFHGDIGISSYAPCE